MRVNNQIDQYISNLVEYFPNLINDIYLIGSRVPGNRPPRIDSDWDLLVFASDNILDNIRSLSSIFNQQHIHILVSKDNNIFHDPFCENIKFILSNCDWQILPDNKACYSKTKRDADETGIIEGKNLALHIYSKNTP